MGSSGGDGQAGPGVAGRALPSVVDDAQRGGETGGSGGGGAPRLERRYNSTALVTRLQWTLDRVHRWIASNRRELESIDPGNPVVLVGKKYQLSSVQVKCLLVRLDSEERLRRNVILDHLEVRESRAAISEVLVLAKRTDDRVKVLELDAKLNREYFSDAVKVRHENFARQPGHAAFGGLCPCCKKQPVLDGTKRHERSHFDHSDNRHENKDSSNCWLICSDCNQRKRFAQGLEYERLQRAFRYYQDQFQAWERVACGPLFTGSP